VKRSPPSDSTRLPFVVYLLAIGTFLMCTSEFLIAGLLPEMASAFGISQARTGLLITAFAIGMIIGGPTMALATTRLPRRVALVLALLVFAAGHVIAAVSSDFAVVLAARVLTALVTGAFWAVASVVATRAAGPVNASRALGVMMSGVGLSTVVGVPVGSWAGQHIGWRGAFWGLAVLAAVSALVFWRLVPADDGHEAVPVRGQLGVLRNVRLWLLLAATMFVAGGFIATFSYVSPLLTEKSGFSTGMVPLALVGFGIGSLLGVNVSGRLADRKPLATFVTVAVGVEVVLLLIVLLAGDAVIAIVLVILLGLTGMSVPPVATGLAVRFGSAAPTLTTGFVVSAFNAGIAGAVWIAGEALDSSLGPTGPALSGAVLVGIGLVPLLALAALIIRRPHPIDEALPQEPCDGALASI
jgi:predicted MFS family arabinose efflux permease